MVHSHTLNWKEKLKFNVLICFPFRNVGGIILEANLGSPIPSSNHLNCIVYLPQQELWDNFREIGKVFIGV
jgi:hypothetical protein